MKKWIALLRGINVGGNHIVPMKELVKSMEENGFSHVKTYIQSGNVVCKYPTPPANKISELIESRFGFKPVVFILSSEELIRAIENNPFPTNVGKALHFFFCDEEPGSIDYAFLDEWKKDTEAYKMIEKVFYLYAPDGIGRSKLAEKMGKALKDVTMTARNYNTIRKLLEMVEDEGN